MKPAIQAHGETAARRELRRRIRRLRQETSALRRARCAERVAVQLTRTALFRNAARLGVYLANDGELDPAPTVKRAWAMHKACFLPVLRKLRPNRLWFAPYTANTRLVPNRYRIQEPTEPNDSWAALIGLDAVLLPLVAFDRRGTRLGMGGGFYDRTFAFLRRRQRWQRPALVGLAYDFQSVEFIAPNPWDVPLDMVITDQAAYTFRQE